MTCDADSLSHLPRSPLRVRPIHLRTKSAKRGCRFGHFAEACVSNQARSRGTDLGLLLKTVGPPMAILIPRDLDLVPPTD